MPDPRVAVFHLSNNEAFEIAGGGMVYSAAAATGERLVLDSNYLRLDRFTEFRNNAVTIEGAMLPADPSDAGRSLANDASGPVAILLDPTADRRVVAILERSARESYAERASEARSGLVSVEPCPPKSIRLPWPVAARLMVAAYGATVREREVTGPRAAFDAYWDEVECLLEQDSATGRRPERHA